MDLDLLARYGPRMLMGLWVTVQVVAISTILGLVLALPIALMRMSRSRILGAISFGYVYFFRGTPLLAQLFLIYYGAGQLRPALESVGLWVFFRDAYFCALLSFTLNNAAYLAEILRGSILAVAKGQWEAADSLGLPRVLTFFRIILPQAMISALRPFGNEIIQTIKASALVSIIAIFDLMGATRLAFARSFNFEVYLWAAVLYLAMVELLRRVWEVLERRLTRHMRPVGAR